MFTYELLDGCLGMKLIADFTTLTDLHEVIHDIYDRSPLLDEDSDIWMLGLAYEVRKAYEQQRDIIEPPAGFPEIGVRYGADMLWPILLPQLRYLRESLACIDHGKKHQAMVYALEYVVETALHEAFGDETEEIMRRLRLLPIDEVRMLMDKIEEFDAWPPSKRRKGLLKLLTPKLMRRTPRSGS